MHPEQPPPPALPRKHRPTAQKQIWDKWAPGVPPSRPMGSLEEELGSVARAGAG